MKYLSTVLIIILFFTFTSCGKQTSNTDNQANADPAKITADDPAKNILEANKLKPLVTVNNPNTMKLETTPRDAKLITNEKKIIEQLAEKFLEYVIKNGLDNALEEINKAKNGVFKDDLVGSYFYLPICKKTSEKIFTILAHTTNRDFIGVEIDFDKWQDLTGWKYANEALDRYNNGVTNRIWVEGIYWKDPNWAGGKPVQFSVYDRFYKINNDEYLYHYCLFTYE